MDKGHSYADKKLIKFEKDIKKQYKKVYYEIANDAKKYFETFKDEDIKKFNLMKSGKITLKQYSDWRKDNMLTGKRYQAMLNEIATKMTDTDAESMKLLEKTLVDVFGENINFGAYEISKALNEFLPFTLYDENAVKSLILDNPTLLPKPKVNIPKDKLWNKKHMNSALFQGIVKGDSIDKIAKRLRTVTNMDLNSAIRNARTMVTSAENSGRLARYQEAKDMGINLQKKWLATLDHVTRASHRDLDGEMRPLDEPFSNGLDYPGASGPPEEVYNCRCTMVSRVLGRTYHSERYEKLNGMSYEEWKKAKGMENKSKSATSKPVPTVVNGKDISQTWKRRPDKFAFEIEDVINAQGFDGKPRVVNAEEFEKAVKESNVIMQRGYRAPNQEILKGYQDTLYRGKWYVDCSGGGSIYGKGMYTVYNKGTEIIDDIADAAKDYARPNRLRGLTAGTIETMTLAPDAKIIKYEEIKDMLFEYNKTHPKIDEGSLAALYGYDAISVGQNDMGYLVILNRTKVIIKENTL